MVNMIIIQTILIGLLKKEQDAYVDDAERVHDYLKHDPSILRTWDFLSLSENPVIWVDMEIKEKFLKIRSDFFLAVADHLFKTVKAIAYPINYLQDVAKLGGSLLDGDKAIQLSNNATWLSDIAKQSLKELN